MKKSIISLAISLAMSGAAIAADDFGLKVQNHLKENAKEYFGFIRPIGASESVTVPRIPGQTALDLIKLAPGLKASIVTRKAGNSSDMMAFWPSDTNPTHIVTCIEAGNTEVGTFPSGQPKLTPSVQTVSLATGEVKTILRGMTGCDGIRRTPWNTIVATEETDDGGLYEIL
ncbi:MAG: hypothetical protein HOO93_17955, partial [Methyloglobulus sp.]|nr:hypothetical protein [Methyloglobulus sp.]